MTKTPEEIIDEGWANDEIVCGWDVRVALDQAGWAIVPKELPEEWRHEFNRQGNWHPDDHFTKALWPDLARFMSRAAQTQKGQPPG